RITLPMTRSTSSGSTHHPRVRKNGAVCAPMTPLNPVNPATSRVRVQYRTHATLEMRARHSDRHRRAAFGGAERTGDLHQMASVIRSLRPRLQHVIVTAQLAFDAQPPRGDPAQIVEPVQRA